VRSLVEAFWEADFYSLEDQSRHLVFDAGVTEITLSIGSRTRVVLDRDSGSRKFDQLAARIVELSHAGKWLAGNAETVPSLLADKDNLNVPDDQGKTVLMWACEKKDSAVLREFLRAGANVRLRDQSGRTALMYAAARGLPGVVEALLQAGADVTEPDSDGETPLIYAAGIRDVWFGKWFSSPGDSSNSWWPIINLFGDPSPEVIQTLLRAGADPNASDSEGATALMYAAESFKAGTHILRVLVDGGANLNQQDNKRRTALMRAADRYRADSVRFLIEAKADLNLRDSHGHTALGRLHPSRDKLFHHDPAYKQIRLLLKRAGAVR
jgi:ankyrin repeat protein